jgi:hypothetical protein
MPDRIPENPAPMQMTLTGRNSSIAWSFNGFSGTVILPGSKRDSVIFCHVYVGFVYLEQRLSPLSLAQTRHRPHVSYIILFDNGYLQRFGVMITPRDLGQGQITTTPLSGTTNIARVLNTRDYVTVDFSKKPSSNMTEMILF